MEKQVFSREIISLKRTKKKVIGLKNITETTKSSTWA